MKEARKVFKNAGLPLILLVVIFSVFKSRIVIPIISKVWSLTLRTTPYGFISNANIGESIKKCPWIIPIVIVLITIFLFFSMWQAAAIVLGIAYTCEDKKTRVRDIVKKSFNYMLHCFYPKNWMMLIYTIIILPFTNIYQATDYIEAFVMPEYIQDFIDANVILHAMYIIVYLVALYFALRCFYLLPAFFLKGFDYKKASRESFTYTKRGAIRNGVKLTIYGFIESIRLALIPFIIMILICIAAFFIMQKEEGALELLSSFAFDSVKDVCTALCGVLVYLSSMCYIVKDYFNHCERDNSLDEIALPKLKEDLNSHASLGFVEIIISVVAGLAIALVYVVCILAIKVEPDLIDTIIKEPIVVAHKGYSSMAPENTMDAFDLADQCENAGLIELDVWSSKDGIPVVLHNESIKAATGVSGMVYDYTYEELQKLPASYSMNTEDFPDARIPSLEEVIATYADSTRLLIEIKGYKKDEELPAKIVALMEKYNCDQSSMIHSGDYAALREVKLCNPNIKCGLIQAIITGDCYDLPYVDFLSVEHSFISDEMIDQLHLRDKELYAWTVNGEDSVPQLTRLGVDGIITDYPDTIAEKMDGTFAPFENLIITNDVGREDAQTAIEEFEEEEY